MQGAPQLAPQCSLRDRSSHFLFLHHHFLISSYMLWRQSHRNQTWPVTCSSSVLSWPCYADPARRVLHVISLNPDVNEALMLVRGLLTLSFRITATCANTHKWHLGSRRVVVRQYWSSSLHNPAMTPEQRSAFGTEIPLSMTTRLGIELA